MVKNPYFTPQRDWNGLVTESQTILECESETCQRTSTKNKVEPSMHVEVRKRGSNLRNPRRLVGCCEEENAQEPVDETVVEWAKTFREA